jgi:hypothetical protein
MCIKIDADLFFILPDTWLQIKIFFHKLFYVLFAYYKKWKISNPISIIWEDI